MSNLERSEAWYAFVEGGERLKQYVSQLLSQLIDRPSPGESELSSRYIDVTETLGGGDETFAEMQVRLHLNALSPADRGVLPVDVWMEAVPVREEYRNDQRHRMRIYETSAELPLAALESSVGAPGLDVAQEIVAAWQQLLNEYGAAESAPEYKVANALYRAWIRHFMEHSVVAADASDADSVPGVCDVADEDRMRRDQARAQAAPRLNRLVEINRRLIDGLLGALAQMQRDVIGQWHARPAEDGAGSTSVMLIVPDQEVRVTGPEGNDIGTLRVSGSLSYIPAQVNSPAGQGWFVVRAFWTGEGWPHPNPLPLGTASVGVPLYQLERCTWWQSHIDLTRDIVFIEWARMSAYAVLVAIAAEQQRCRAGVS